jgi:hypothetical protein
MISINSIHSLPSARCIKTLQEIVRVSKTYKFICVDAWYTEEEHQRLLDRVLTAEIYMSVDDREKTSNEVGYTSNYFRFIP